MEKILLIRLKSIGDVVFTLPAVNVVRDHFPDARITFLTSVENAPLLQGFTAVDEVLTLDRSGLSRRGPVKIASATLVLLRQLRERAFSRVFDFQSYGETELLSWWTGAPERWGIVYSSNRGWLYTGTSRRITDVHPAEWNLQLLHAAGLKPGSLRNNYVLPETSMAPAREFFRSNHLETCRPTVFIQPFTSNPDKNWPLENFLALAKLGRARGLQVIFGGGPAESVALEPARAAGFVVAAGVPLMVSAALMQLSTLVAGGDTGLLHLAMAMNRRVVMLMQYNLPGCCCPFQHPEWAVSSPNGVTANITVEQAAAAVDQALSEAPAKVN